jgi:hypothetical protein
MATVQVARAVRGVAVAVRSHPCQMASLVLEIVVLLVAGVNRLARIGETGFFLTSQMHTMLRS